jgi:hypothetical protein
MMETHEEVQDQTIKDETWHAMADDIIADAKAQATERGFDIDNIFFSGFGSQGDGASWTGYVHVPEYLEWKLSNGGVDGLDDITLEVMFWLFNGGVFDRKLVVTADGHYNHEKTMSIADFYWTYMGDNDIETMGNWGGPFADTPIIELLNATGWTWETEMDANDTYNRLWAQILNDARGYAVDTYKRLEEAYYSVYFD